MRSEIKEVLLAFFRDPTQKTFRGVEDLSDEIDAQMSLFKSGKAQDQQLFDAFARALIGSTFDDEHARCIKVFMDRFYGNDWEQMLLSVDDVEQPTRFPPLRLVAVEPYEAVPVAIDDINHLFVSPEDFEYRERPQGPDESGD